MHTLMKHRGALDFHLFQAHMWIDYVRAWDGRPTSRRTKYSLLWLETVLTVSRAECLQRARVHLYLARRLNRKYRAENAKNTRV